LQGQTIQIHHDRSWRFLPDNRSILTGKKERPGEEDAQNGQIG
jgi:hypothetical protein